MKKKSFLLFLTIVAVFFITDRAVYLMLHRIEKEVFTGQSVGKANLFNKVKDSVELLVMGSSRAARHVDPDLFPLSGYNMGMDGTHLGYATALLSSLNRKGQTILVHVDHHEVFNADYMGEDMLALLNESMDSEEMEGFINEYYPEDILLSKMTNCYVYNGKVLGMFKNAFMDSGVSKPTNGFSPLTPSAQQKQTFEQILEKEGITQNIEMPDTLVVNEKFESMVDFAIETAKRNNSKLIFFTSPSLNKVKKGARQRTTDFFNSKGLLYLDDLDFFKEFDIDYWKDRSHMSKLGAEIYSTKLEKDISPFIEVH
ncbi:hypothetical protein [Flagellimonas sp.]|uniref:hypothetical protein n=1 Tax=Flagellimonas sp. TaxID=2058762 RepID=UPI003AB33A86